MKEKEKFNADEMLAQLADGKSSEAVLKSVYSKLNCSFLSHVQRNRLLKIMLLHITKEDVSSDVRVSALNAGLSIAKGDLAPTSNGVFFNFIEACLKVVDEFAANPNSHSIDVVDGALRILALLSAATLTKLLQEKGSVRFGKIITVCVSENQLRLHGLMLLQTAMSAPVDEALYQAVSDEKEALIEQVYPFIFNPEAKAAQEVALKIMKTFNMTTIPRSLLSRLKEDTQRKYCNQMTEMVRQGKTTWPETWQFVVNMFGDELHSGGQLINYMLEVLEKAFKHSDLRWTRAQAFECWRTLIDNFKSGLKNKKRLDLIMIPLKANNHRTEILALAKLDTYDHLLKAIGKELTLYPDILLCFFSFCFTVGRSTCPPVRSYPTLHEKCAQSISKVLMSPFIEDMFLQVHKELIEAVAECVTMENVARDILLKMCRRLLELVSKQEGAGVVKALLCSINSIVTRAGSGDIDGSLSRRPNLSPPTSPRGPLQPNEGVGRKIALVTLCELIDGEFALQNNQLRNRSLYVGSSDVMNGTPILLMLEWLLSPALVLGAGNTQEFILLVSKLISLYRMERNGFMDFTSTVVKKLLVFDDKLPLSKKTPFFQYATDVWCVLAKEIVKFHHNQGELIQGDAVKVGLGALDSVLMFPVQHLYSETGLVNKCCSDWINLFYEACRDAELNSSTSAEELCRSVCSHMLRCCKKNKIPQQFASVFCFLKCLLLASTKLKATKTSLRMHQHVSSIFKELKEAQFDQELVFLSAAACVESCLNVKTVTRELISNVCPITCALLSSKVNTYLPIQKLCDLFSALKKAVADLSHHNSTKEGVSTLLTDVLNAGRNHTSQKLRSKIAELFDTSGSQATPLKHTSSPKKECKSPVAVNSLLPSPRILGASPKTNSKKHPTIQMSPTNLSPIGRKLQTTVCGSDGKFVRIETPPKKIILTEHQKEVRQERRKGATNIPALYQDLSQDTQSMSQDGSQDFVSLPPTPQGKSNMIVDDDAVMDIDIIVKPDVPSPCPKKMETVRSVKSGQSSREQKIFTPPAGFLLPSIPNDGLSKPDSKMDQSSDLSLQARKDSAKENEAASSPDNSSRGALTRSNSNTSLTTRSGRIVKRSSSTPDADLKVKKRAVRKSLPATFVDLKASEEETIVIESDTTDTESVSSIASDASGASSRPGKRRGKLSNKGKGFESKPAVAEEQMTAAEQTDEVDPVTKNNDKNTEVLKAGYQSRSSLNELCLKPVVGKASTRSRPNSNLDVLSTKTSVTEVEAGSTSRSISSETVLPCLNGETKQNSNSSVVSKQPISSPARINASVIKNPGESKTVATNSEKLNSSERALTSPKNDIEAVNTSSESLNGLEESEDIIESSQEHTINGIKVKKCHVSLKFLNVNDQSTEIENVCVEKGPSNGSPFKVSIKRAATPQSPARRSLVLDNSENSIVVKSRIMPEPEVVPEIMADDLESNNIQLEAADNSASKLPPKDAQSRETEGVHVTPVNSDIHSRSDSQPEWMHGKKTSPPNKGSKVIRSISSRSQALMKNVTDANLSSSPPKSMDMSPMSSPVQSKRTSKTADSGSNSTPVSKRPSRAAQLVGLGQAAAERGGHKVLPNAFRPPRSDKSGEVSEDNDHPSASSSSIFPVASNYNATLVNGSSNAAGVSTTATASPSVKKPGRLLELDSQKSTPHKCLKDRGMEEDWVPRTPRAEATPDSSILKRKREADTEASSPSVKRKRVSFRDPPLTSLLEFGEAKGTVFSSNRSDSERVGDPSSLEGVEEVCDVIRPMKGSDKEQPDAAQLSSCKDSPSSSSRKNGAKRMSNGDVDSDLMASSPERGRRRSLQENTTSKSTSKEERKCSKSDTELSYKKGVPSSVDEDMEVDVQGVSDKSHGGGSEQSEGETQGMLDDLHRMPSESPIYQSLVGCTHPITSVSSQLTSAVWERALILEFDEKKIFTVGDLAKLTEQQLDRLQVKQPKRTNVCNVLEDFEKRHNISRDVDCELYKVVTSSNKVKMCPKEDGQGSLENVLANASDEDIAKTLSKLGRDKLFYPVMTKYLQPVDVAAVIGADRRILQILPIDEVAEAYISQVPTSSGEKEKTMTVDQLLSILNRVSGKVLEDALFPSNPDPLSARLTPFMQDYVLENCPSTDIMQQVFQKLKPSGIIGSLDKSNMYQLLQAIFEKCSPSDFVGHLNTSQLLKPMIENCSHSEVVECLDDQKVQKLLETLLQKCSTSEIFHSLDSAKAVQLFKTVLSKCSPEVVSLDNSHVDVLLEILIKAVGQEQLASKVLPSLRPSDISKSLEGLKAEETIKALCSTLDAKEAIRVHCEWLMSVRDKLK